MQHLILLHGALGASTQLLPLAVSLADAFTVHVMDFEGHGDAPHAGRPYRMEHFAENVRRLMRSRGSDRAHLVGYSMGGYVAATLAASHPAMVDRVVTLGTKYRWDPATAARESARLDPDTIRAKVPRFADALAERHANAGGWEAVLARTSELLRHLGDHPLPDDLLVSVQAPVLVMAGDRDNTVTADECREVAGRMPLGRVEVLPDAPHPIEQVALDRLLPPLRAFLSA